MSEAQPVWTEPRTWRHDDFVDATALNVDVRDNLLWLKHYRWTAEIGDFGGNLGMRIRAAHDALPAEGGVIDARFLGDVTPSTTATTTFTKPVKLLLGVYTFDCAGIVNGAGGSGRVTLEGIMQGLSVVQNTSGTALTVGGKWNMRSLSVLSSGGHTIMQNASLGQCQWEWVELEQDSDGYSVYVNHDGTTSHTLVELRTTDAYLKHTPTSTVPAINLVSAGGNINNNVWERVRADRCGSAHFFHVEATGSNVQYRNVWRDINFEVCMGGGIRLIACRGWIIENGTCWDVDSGPGSDPRVVNDFYSFEANANDLGCNQGGLDNLTRLASKLASGVYDVDLPGAGLGSNIQLNQCVNPSSGDPFAVNLRGNKALITGHAPNLDTAEGAENTTVFGTDGVRFFGGAKLNKWLAGSATVDPPSIDAGTYHHFSISVPGAAVGDHVSVTPDGTPAVPSGVSFFGAVDNADEVRVRLTNHTSGSVDPASATWQAIVTSYG